MKPVLFFLLLLGSSAAVAQAPPSPPALRWITLGTNGGPVVNKDRSEPANLLLVEGKPWLVDCGDGAMERLAQAGFQGRQVDYVFLSHLHLDHIGGLQGFIGLRWMNGARTPVTIYGPPGTEQVVAGIVQSLQPSVQISANEPTTGLTPAQMVRVVLVPDNADLLVAGVKIRVARTSHFNTEAGPPADNGSQALAYRFEYGGQVVVYTGDTGPSAALTQLAHGADLLVSEVIDLPAMNQLIKSVPYLDEPTKQLMVDHFERQHLTPQEAGKLAATAAVKKLVFTHLAVPPATTHNTLMPTLVAGAHETFKGEVVVARDLDQF